MAQPQDRQWFFDAQPTSDGLRFRTKNIPEEDTYKTLVASVAFLLESDDVAKTGAQGLIKLYDDQKAIDERYSVLTANTEIRAVRSHQLPGVGVLKSGAYFEPILSGSGSATANGQGIKVTALQHDQFTFEKLSYQVELDPGSLNDYADQSDSDLKVIVYDDGTSKAIGLKDYNGDKYFFDNRGPNNIWTVPHKLGKFPSVVVKNLLGEEINGQITHNDTDNLTIEFNQAIEGSVSCN